MCITIGIFKKYGVFIESIIKMLQCNVCACRGLIDRIIIVYHSVMSVYVYKIVIKKICINK